MIRGGYGMFYNPLDRIGSEDQLALNPPGLRNINQQTTSTTTPVLADAATASRPTTSTRRTSCSAGCSSAPPTRAARTRGTSSSRPASSGSWAATSSVSADFIGNLGRNIAVLRNLNQPANGNGARPYPEFGHIQWRDPVGSRTTTGMDVSLEKRFSQGYSYRVAYTLGESRDQAPEHLAATSGRQQDTNDLDAWEGPSDFDVRHRLVANFVVEPPVGAGRHRPRRRRQRHPRRLDAWPASTPRAPAGRSRSPRAASRARRGCPTWSAIRRAQETVDNWFNVAAFERVPAGVFGNAGRNSLRGPGYVTFDMSLQRRIGLHDRVAATLRWDVFNLFDRANFGNPNVGHHRRQRRDHLDAGRRPAGDAVLRPVAFLEAADRGTRAPADRGIGVKRSTFASCIVLAAAMHGGTSARRPRWAATSASSHRGQPRASSNRSTREL